MTTTPPLESSDDESNSPPSPLRIPKTRAPFDVTVRRLTWNKDKLTRVSAELKKEAIALEKRNNEIIMESSNLIDREEDIKTFIINRVEYLRFIRAFNTNSRRSIQEKAARGEIKGSEKKKLMRIIDDYDIKAIEEEMQIRIDQARLIQILTGFTGQCLGDIYIEVLQERMETGGSQLGKTSNKRSSSDQTSFRRKCLKAYDPGYKRHLEEKQITVSKVYSPVVAGYIGFETARAAHIVPYATRLSIFAHIFGIPRFKAETTLWSEDNSLTLPGPYEQAFDKGQLIIIPDETTGQLKTVLLDRSDSFWKAHAAYISADDTVFTRHAFDYFHNKKLEFISDQRPSMQFLYFNTLMVLSRQRIHHVMGWQENWKKLLTRKIWGPPTFKNLHRAALVSLAAYVGDVLNPSLITEFFGPGADSFEPENDPDSLDMEAGAVSPHLRRARLQEEVEGDERGIEEIAEDIEAMEMYQ